VKDLVERAGHTVRGVAKEYDEGMPLPDGRLDLVVAAGGDGTVATVARVASKTSAALAILPLGTANNIAASLGLSGTIPELIVSWTNARRVSLDLGCARAGSKEWPIVEGAGGGLVPAGIARAKAAWTRREEGAPAAAIAAAVRAFHDALGDLEGHPWTLVVDGRTIADTFLLVEALNIQSIGPNLVLAPDANPSDGYFDVILADESHRDQLRSYLEQRAEGRDARLSLPRHRAREVTIESCADLHIDDELVDTCELGPISIRIEPAAIQVLA
jgi:diacylglycerol kinase family enzyme